MSRDYGSRHYRRKKNKASSKSLGKVKWWIAAGIFLGSVIALFSYFALKGNALLRDLKPPKVNSMSTKIDSQSKKTKMDNILPRPEPAFDFYDKNAKVKIHIPAKNSPVLATESSDYKSKAKQLTDNFDSSLIANKESNTSNPFEPTNDLIIPLDPTINRQDLLSSEKLALEQQIEKDLEEQPIASSTIKSPIKRYIIVAGSFKEYSSANQERAHLAILGFDFKIELTSNQQVLYRLWQGPYAELKKAQEQQRTLLKADIKTIITPQLNTND